MAFVLLAGAAMAQTKTVEFRFARENTTNLTEIPVVVTIDGEATTEITATLSATATNVDELQNLDAGIVCFKNEGNGNSGSATEADPHIYTLTINGLESIGGKITNISILNKALNGSGAAQYGSTERLRHYNVSYGNSIEGLTLVEHRIDYISGENIDGGTERAKDFEVSKTCKMTSPSILQLKMYNIVNGDDGYTQEKANGCFFGLTGFKLTLHDFSYTLSQLTASKLMEKTEPTYIAITGLSSNLHGFFTGNGMSDDFSNSYIFIWEPVGDGTYRIKNLNGEYMQNSAPKTWGTVENSAVFSTVNATTSGSSQTGFNGDAAANDYIANGTDANIVRFVKGGSTGTTWLNFGSNSYQNGSGSWSIYFVYEATEVTDFTVNITDAQFATFYAPVNVVLPDNATAYIIDGIKENNWLNLVEITGILPANTGILLHSESEAECTLAVTTEDATETVTNNKLAGTINDSYITKNEENAYYILSKDTEGNVGMLNPVLGTNKNKFKNYANKAYMILPAAQSTVAFYGFDWDGTTGIEQITDNREQSTAIYDLTGRRIEAITAPGIYIVNGKKTLVR